MSSFSYNEIYDIGDVTSAALKRLGYNSCVVGSVACAAWGMRNRTPQDVDIVVLNQNVDLEAVKRSLANSDAHFYLVDSVNPSASYRVFWYRHDDGRRCKVDLLKPGELTVPSVPVGELYTIKNRSDIRVMPFIPVLLLKVQAWWHHKNSDKVHFREKVPQDVRDINELLEIAIRDGYKLRDVKSWLPGWIQDVGQRHVEQFKWEYGSSSSSWARIMV